MTKILERAARALQQWHHEQHKLRPSWQEAQAQALAVLKAIREPDEAMIEARAVGYKGEAWANWQAMIDSITGEQG